MFTRASASVLIMATCVLAGMGPAHAQPAAPPPTREEGPRNLRLPLEPIPVGSPAPRLEGGEWIKGKLPEGYPDKGLFLVSFNLVPAQFQADHRQLQFIGVLADNRTDDQRRRYPDEVKKRWNTYPNDTPPNIVYLQNDGLAPWFGPGLRDEPGAAHCFLIRDGRVIWTGRPEIDSHDAGVERPRFGSLAIHQHILGPYPINQPAPPWPALAWNSGPKLDGPPKGKLSLVTLWPLLKRGGDAAKRHEQLITEFRATLKKHPDLVSFAILPVPSKDKIGSGPGKDDSAADRIKYGLSLLKPLGSVYTSEGDQDRDDGFGQGWLRRYSLAAVPAAIIIDTEGRVAWVGPLSMGDAKSRGQQLAQLDAALTAVAAGQPAPIPSQFDESALAAKNREREEQAPKNKRGPQPGP